MKYLNKKTKETVEAFRYGYHDIPEWYIDYVRNRKGMHVSLMPVYGQWIVKYQDGEVRNLYDDIFRKNYERKR